MSDHELLRLLEEERDALQRYSHIKLNFVRTSDVVESARLIWTEATAALLKYQDKHGA